MTTLYQYCNNCKRERNFHVTSLECTTCGRKNAPTKGESVSYQGNMTDTDKLLREPQKTI